MGALVAGLTSLDMVIIRAQTFRRLRTLRGFQKSSSELLGLWFGKGVILAELFHFSVFLFSPVQNGDKRTQLYGIVCETGLGIACV